MSLVVGYRGPQMMDRNFVDNPLASAVSPDIYVSDTEVAPILASFGLPPWELLNPVQKSKIAQQVLLNRGDYTSRRQAEQLSLNVAVFNNVQMVRSPEVQDSQFPSLSDFLL